MRYLALALVSLAWQPPAFAQNVEPEVTVQQLSDKSHAPVAEDEPAVLSSDEFYRLRSKASFVEEVAVIRIAFKGKWYKSADNMAKEKAALLGANGLVQVEPPGREVQRRAAGRRGADEFPELVQMKGLTEAALKPRLPRQADILRAAGDHRLDVIELETFAKLYRKPLSYFVQ